MVAAVAIVVVGATGAFFSDTETSSGNTFTAGAIDLKVDSEQHYNNAKCVDNVWALEDGAVATVPQYPVIGSDCGGTWGQTEGLDIVGEKFFDFGDIKPGDFGENTISLHVINNDAWVCAQVSNLTNDDNTQTEPEASVDANGLATGELQQAMVWKIWRDDGLDSNGTEIDGAVAGDNIYQEGEEILAEGSPVNGVLPLYDSSTGPALQGDSMTYLGVSWSLPASVGNEVQTDSMTGDISFEVVQARNNTDFVCGEERPIPTSYHISLENKSAQWDVLSGDNTFGDIQYSTNYSDFHGVVTGTGLTPNSPYQITLNGPGACTATDAALAGAGANAFESGYWNNGTNLEPTCGTPGEGVLNMDLTSNWYTVMTDSNGAFTHNFSFNMPAGNYSGVKVLVKKMLNPFNSPWVDTTGDYPTFNLYETAPISFTVL